MLAPTSHIPTSCSGTGRVLTPSRPTERRILTWADISRPRAMVNSHWWEISVGLLSNLTGPERDPPANGLEGSQRELESSIYRPVWWSWRESNPPHFEPEIVPPSLPCTIPCTNNLCGPEGRRWLVTDLPIARRRSIAWYNRPSVQLGATASSADAYAGTTASI